MDLAGVPRVLIHPDEQFGQAFRYFSGRTIPTGVTLSSATVATEDLNSGADTSADVLGSTTGVIDNSGDPQTVTASIQGGGSAFDGTEHKVTITTTLSSGDVYVDVFVLVVTDRVTEC